MYLHLLISLQQLRNIWIGKFHYTFSSIYVHFGSKKTLITENSYALDYSTKVF